MDKSNLVKMNEKNTKKSQILKKGACIEIYTIKNTSKAINTDKLIKG